jgi:hypothetical protein
MDASSCSVDGVNWVDAKELESGAFSSGTSFGREANPSIYIGLLGRTAINDEFHLSLDE